MLFYETLSSTQQVFIYLRVNSTEEYTRDSGVYVISCTPEYCICDYICLFEMRTAFRWVYYRISTESYRKDFLQLFLLV